MFRDTLLYGRHMVANLLTQMLWNKRRSARGSVRLVGERVSQDSFRWIRWFWLYSGSRRFGSRPSGLWDLFALTTAGWGSESRLLFCQSPVPWSVKSCARQSHEGFFFFPSLHVFSVLLIPSGIINTIPILDRIKFTSVGKKKNYDKRCKVLLICSELTGSWEEPSLLVPSVNVSAGACSFYTSLKAIFLTCIRAISTGPLPRQAWGDTGQTERRRGDDNVLSIALRHTTVIETKLMPKHIHKQYSCNEIYGQLDKHDCPCRAQERVHLTPVLSKSDRVLVWVWAFVCMWLCSVACEQ